MCHFEIYKPGTLVYFCHDQGIKLGKVVSITTQRHENGEHSQWQVMEVSEHQEKVIYNLPLQHLCLDLENIEERAKKGNTKLCLL